MPISLPIIEYYFLKDSINPVISGTVAIIIWYGFLSHFFANKEIGKNCSASIEKDKEQKLVTSGIYRYIRHPLYLRNIYGDGNLFPILVEFVITFSLSFDDRLNLILCSLINIQNT